MEYILIALIILVVILFILMKFLNKFMLNKEKAEIIEILNKYGEYYKENSLFLYKNDLFKIEFLVIKQEEELIINNPYLFEKFYKNKSELINTEFLKTDLFKTILIIYPSNAPIKRYLNENELIFIDDIFINEDYLLTQKYYLEELLSKGFKL